jgi:Nucleotidyl transferase AbiEii toxin, Type IV TA system
LPDSPDFAALLARITSALAQWGLRFMVVGGQAVLLHGEPRLTQDIDITLAASTDRLDDVLAASEAAGFTPLPGDVRAFVAETFVLPAADPVTGARVDFIFSNTSYEQIAVARAQAVQLGGAAVPFATAEDLLLLKLFAGRPRDIEDAEGIVRRKGTQLDWLYINRWATEFAQVRGREHLTELVDRLASAGGEAPTQ